MLRSSLMFPCKLDDDAPFRDSRQNRWQIAEMSVLKKQMWYLV